MRIHFPSTGIVLALAAASFLTGCGNFWQAPGSTGTSTGTTTTTTTLTPSTSTPTTGSTVVLTATVSPSAATGSVTFYANSASLGTGTLDSGTATLNTSFSTAGTESLTATYGGSSTYASSTSSAVSITVSAASSSARVGRPVTADSIHTTGYGAAPIHALGAFNAAGANYSAQDAEAVVVEGGGSVKLTSSTLSGAGGAGRAVLFANSSPDADAQAQARFTMNGGTITYRRAAAASEGAQNEPTVFAVTNAKAAIALTDATAGGGDAGALLTAGQVGAQGIVAFTAKGSMLNGDVRVGANGEAALALLGDDAGRGTVLTGAINPDDAAGTVSVTLDNRSTWTVTGASHLTSLSGLDVSGGVVDNIDGGGHCVYYSGSVNDASGNAVYALRGGGFLTPEGTSGPGCP